MYKWLCIAAKTRSELFLRGKVEEKRYIYNGREAEMYERLLFCLKTALDYHVTDIHFTVREGDVVIEMRIGNTMKRLRRDEKDPAFFHYLMYRADLDVADVLTPQTGRFEETVDGRVISLRFAVVASYHLTSGVLRLLNQMPALTCDRLTDDPEQIRWLKTITRHRSGLYVFSGPTGSGKTTTLYTLLNETENKKIFTLEDPVEVVSGRYVQLQINERQNLSWNDGIRQLLRHDPDIIMIGEIRDNVAAMNAVRCALSGHLVVTSLHSRSCISAIHRLIDLGVSRTQLFDVLDGIVSQRLYDTGDGERICVYEIMDRKEIEYYERNGIHSEGYTDLRGRVEDAVRKGILPYGAAESDLLG